MITRAELLKAAPVLGSIFVLPAADAIGATRKGPRRELKRELKAQLATQKANERRAVRLRNHQEDVVRETHNVIQNRMSALKSEVNGNGEKAAVETAREALHDQAKVIHVETQQTMAEQLQMLRSQGNETERLISEL
jgi:hypothetical protein